MTFSEELKNHRKRAGLTRAQFAPLVGFSPSIIEKWESKKRTPRTLTANAVLRLAKRIKSKSPLPA